MTSEIGAVMRSRADRISFATMLANLRVPDGSLYSILIQPVRDVRTPEQNRLYWLRVRAIARFTGETPRRLHVLFVQEFLPDLAHLLDDPSAQITSSLSTERFTEFIDMVDGWAMTELPGWECHVPKSSAPRRPCRTAIASTTAIRNPR